MARTKKKADHTSVKKRFCYSPSKVESAVKAIKNGMAALKASKIFGVPRSTLRHKIAGRSPLSYGHIGPQAVLGVDIENQLEELILEIARMGFPITKEQLSDSVQKIVEANNIKTPFQNARPGRKWYDSFMKRHPRISCKKAEYLNKARANITENKIRGWFNEVKELLGEDVSVLDNPQSVYNTDETSFYLCPKGTRVLAPKGESIYDVSSSSDKENFTILIMVNAAGEIAPPLSVFKYRRLPQLIIKNAPEDWGIGISDSGWMTGKTFYEYIVNVFYPYLLERKSSFPVIIFLDGHKSHITLHLSNFCRENSIIIVALYPNTTHLLQPLDVSVFGPLKQRWKSLCRKWRFEHNYEDITKYSICQMLKEILFHPSTSSAIKAGFRSCGIYPFNPDNVNYSNCIKVKPNSLISSRPISYQTSHLEYLESHIQPELLLSFKETKSKRMDWQGDVEASRLFNVWLNFQDHIGSLKADEKTSADSLSPIALNRDVTKVEERPSVSTVISDEEPIVSISPGRKSMINIFPSACFWPLDKPDVASKKNRKFQRVPSVITSDLGRKFLEEKQKNKEKNKTSKKTN